MTPDSDLQRQSEVADAELGVAEELGWPLAILAGLVIYLKWDSWLVGVAIAIGAYVLAIYRYRRRAAKAEDRYFRAAGLGKYAGSHVNDA
jgi:hypothetical protein